MGSFDLCPEPAKAAQPGTKKSSEGSSSEVPPQSQAWFEPGATTNGDQSKPQMKVEYNLQNLGGEEEMGSTSVKGGERVEVVVFESEGGKSDREEEDNLSQHHTEKETGNEIRAITPVQPIKQGNGGKKGTKSSNKQEGKKGQLGLCRCLSQLSPRFSQLPGCGCCYVAMNFPGQKIDSIRACVTTTSYSININGSLMVFSKGLKGKRQGDPLSPYLFVIVMEVLVGCIRSKCSDSNFKFHWRCKKNRIAYLCFADDLLIFCNGDATSVGLGTSGTELKSSGSNVAWDDICGPKYEGGLGIKEVGVWNKATIAKHIWFLIVGGEGSMWCQSVKSYLLRGRSFGDVKVPQDSSWILRKILGLRVSVYPYIVHRLGNGKDIFTWFDIWHSLSPLLDHFGGRILDGNASPRNAKLESFIRGNVPRFSVIAWMAFRERHSTRDRLVNIGCVEILSVSFVALRMNLIITCSLIVNSPLGFSSVICVVVVYGLALE
ncbi:hypothetical protein Acr_24g0005700 [Actinidia rufa]|uniref:Reverse transcriptase domain-containing protein n=1 Tax=Actinidia rufa TaxID=165716 RepID=A0A7J0GU69_9ERIC|nr:hypothetical protein Acr_24g0005700 [Actinidia rufa]